MLFSKSVCLAFIVNIALSSHRLRLVDGLTLPSRSLTHASGAAESTSRREILGQFLAAGAGVASAPLPALAAPDCVADCLKNCRKIAPKDPDYCDMNCNDYCAQEDRTDGLSGGDSAANSEV